MGVPPKTPAAAGGGEAGGAASGPVAGPAATPVAAEPGPAAMTRPGLAGEPHDPALPAGPAPTPAAAEPESAAATRPGRTGEPHDPALPTGPAPTPTATEPESAAKTRPGRTGEPHDPALPAGPTHMTPAEFRRWGYAVVDWLAQYQQRVASLPVLAPVAPGQIRASLPAAAPESGEPFADVLRDVEEKLLPGLTHWQSPSFFAYFPGNTSGPSILGELLAAGLGVQGMLWSTSPACTELETLVLDWLVAMLGLPSTFLSTGPGGGVLQDSASSAALCALLAARDRAARRHDAVASSAIAASASAPGNATGNPPAAALLGSATGDLPAASGRLTVYATAQAHSSIDKAVHIAGLGRAQLRRVATDDGFAMDPADLEAQLAADQAAGHVPCWVVATVGTTSSQAMDPLAAIGPLCRRYGAWLHVDAAMAGTAMLCPEFRSLQQGLEWADSYCFNPHKWMCTNFDCDCFWVADRQALINALSVVPEYLRNAASASGAVIDYRDWQVPLGRRFRSLKLWMVIRHYGVSGLQALVRRHVALTRDLAARIGADGRFELVVPPPLNLVCFRLRGGDDLNQRLLDRLNRSGRLFLSHTRLADRLVLRLCVGQTHTEPVHVNQAWEQIQATATELLAAGG